MVYEVEVKARLQYAARLDHIPIECETKRRWVVCKFDNSIIDTSEPTRVGTRSFCSNSPFNLVYLHPLIGL
jgi:hypothetical protein